MSSIEEKVSYRFDDPVLLQTALTHPSIVAESKEELVDNQRLEYLGDAVLQLAVTEELFLRFPNEGEGPLTKWRARLVSKPALAEYGMKLNLGSAILIGKGEEANGGRTRASSLADCIEALLGAIYLDGGFSAAKEVALNLVADALEEVTKSSDTGNPKGELQEVLQAIQPTSPVYEILSASGPDHDKVFVASVKWQDVLLGRGEGASKKTAEVAAAANALERGKWREMA
ncbi:ribonuclease III [Roseibacillus persicicus]|uniref:Ribonuclease 3 n=1 Tax=Roseibacillus persicicus TaxID=454148 RepID=A0A918TN35_9BACT|nr:ribonuclease III [Roseibacillus persicicus]GHC54248.1 ribonuclease 3 [Roseibacillus persicicus]